MALKTFKPTSAGRRQLVIVDRSELHKGGPVKALTEGKKRNGGRNNAYTSEDMTVYHFDFAADRWKEGLKVEADRMRNTRIDAKHEFEQEKGAVIAELKRNEDGPWELEQKAILPLLFVFLFLQRWLVQGIAQTGIKG